MTNKMAKIAVYVFLLLVAIGLLVWWFNYNQQKGRDSERLAAMKILQAELLNYYGRHNTYQITGCQPPAAVNLCGGESGRSVATSQLIDPTNHGQFQYLINDLTDNDFSASFVLEAGIDGIAAGRHILTKNGIK